MSKIEAASRYGLAADRKAEPPARPAAIMNGKSGKQQLDAARTLPIAARLANVVRAPLCCPGSVVLAETVVCSRILIMPVLLSVPLESFPRTAHPPRSAGRRSPSP